MVLQRGEDHTSHRTRPNWEPKCRPDLRQVEHSHARFVPRSWTRACWCASVAGLPLRFKLPHTLPAAVLARNGKGYGAVEEAAVELARCREHCLIHRCSRDCGILGQTRFGYGHASPALIYAGALQGDKERPGARSVILASP